MLVIIVSMTLIQFDLSFTHINEASYIQVLWADFLFFFFYTLMNSCPLVWIVLILRRLKCCPKWPPTYRQPIPMYRRTLVMG